MVASRNRRVGCGGGGAFDFQHRILVLCAQCGIAAALMGCAAGGKDWYVHVVAHPKMDLDISIGRGSASTVHKIVDEDHAE